MTIFSARSGVTSRAAYLAMVLGMVCPAIATAAPSKPPGGQLQLADLGEIAQWQKGGANTVFIEDKSDHWYRVDLAETCMNLDTSKGILFLTEANTDTPGRHSMIEINHHQCRVSSLAPSAAPSH